MTKRFINDDLLEPTPEELLSEEIAYARQKDSNRLAALSAINLEEDQRVNSFYLNVVEENWKQLSELFLRGQDANQRDERQINLLKEQIQAAIKYLGNCSDGCMQFNNLNNWQQQLEKAPYYKLGWIDMDRHEDGTPRPNRIVLTPKGQEVYGRYTQIITEQREKRKNYNPNSQEVSQRVQEQVTSTLSQ